MRLWALLCLIFFLAIGMTLARDPVGRVAVIVFLTMLVEVTIGVTAVMTLFTTIGAIGKAERPIAYGSALVSTAMVLIVSSVLMVVFLYAGLVVIRAVVE